MNTKPNDSKIVPDVQRQYSLLREFNLGQAQAGDEILSVLSPSYSYKEVAHEVKFKGITSNLKEVFVEDEQGEGYCRSSLRIKMKPLCWIEGKPVYKGDKLWYKSKADNTYYQHEAWSITSDHLFDEGSFGFVEVSLLSWDKPQPLCWIEGKPVYKGDVLYKTSPYTKAFTASSAFKDIGITNTEGRWCCSKYLTWSKPTVRHFHQNLIEAWENGVEIEFLNITGEWVYASTPTWNQDHSYRIKPKEPKKKSGWINLWKASCGTVGVSAGSSVYSSKEDALAGLCLDGHLGTIEIHWEE